MPSVAVTRQQSDAGGEQRREGPSDKKHQTSSIVWLCCVWGCTMALGLATCPTI